ncbi:hypothetical protein ACH5RR_005385 [Cinchona calisaya]|uniref:Uncharacterized protein n=1 Tax=Cinchona calisaya TaxID=153742 RepID=A0ABD3AL27_9GENT
MERPSTKGLETTSYSDPWISVKPARNCIFCSKVVGLDHQPVYPFYRKKRHHLRLTVNESVRASASGEVERMRVLDWSNHYKMLLDFRNLQSENRAHHQKSLGFQLHGLASTKLHRLKNYTIRHKKLKAVWKNWFTELLVSDLEWIRRRKEEAEFLEATFRAKEASLKQGGDASDSSSIRNERQQSRVKDKSASINRDTIGASYSANQPNTVALGCQMGDGNDDTYFDQGIASTGIPDPEPNEIQCFDSEGLN